MCLVFMLSWLRSGTVGPVGAVVPQQGAIVSVSALSSSGQAVCLAGTEDEWSDPAVSAQWWINAHLPILITSQRGQVQGSVLLTHVSQQIHRANDARYSRLAAFAGITACCLKRRVWFAVTT